MWPFRRRPSVEVLRGYKKIRVKDAVFTIQKINPLVDFADGKMPMIFTSFVTRRKPTEAEKITPESIKKLREEMGMVIRAGMVEPKIVADDKGNEGITVADLFRDPDMAHKVYLEIMLHALNQFGGWRGVFFSIKIRRLLYTALRNFTENSQST